MLYLRQSTASQSVLIGPFVDSTDGVTAETGLTIDAADIRLSANGGNMAAKNSGGGTHDELGYYTITLDATDTATVGRLQLCVAESGALPVYHEFQVLEEAIYDGMFAASAARIPADVTAISGDTTAADNLESYTDGTTPMPVNATQISGDGTAADNIEAAFDGTGGVTMTLAQLAFNPTGSGDCIIMGGSGAGNGIGFTRTGAGEVFDTNVAAALQTEAADAITAASLATASALATVDGNVDAILLDTAEIGAAGAGLSAIPWNASWDTEVQSEVTDALNAYDPPTRAELTTDTGTITTAIDALNDISAADVNTQVLDVLNTDTFAEPTGVPAATATLAAKLGYLYMALRNKVTVTASKKTFFDDGDNAEWEKDLSDDGTTYTETEGNAI